MAKSKMNGWASVLAIIGACGVISAISARIITRVETQAVQSHMVEDTNKAVGGLKEDGCDPAVEARTNIAVIGVEIKNIKDDVADMRAEQKTNTTAILKAINDKP